MIEITKDKKSDCYILTQTDSEGFHKQLTLSVRDLYILERRIHSYVVYLPLGTDIDNAYQILQRERFLYQHPIYAEFNSAILSSDMSLDECYQAVLGMTKVEYEAKKTPYLPH